MVKNNAGRLVLCMGTILIIVILMTICSCTSKKEDTGKIKISIACSYSPTDAGVQAINRSIDKFMIEHPDIFVKKIWMSRDYWSKLMTMVAGGTAPDIFRVGPDMVPACISKGILLPLDDFIKDSSVLKMEDFFPQVSGILNPK